MNWRVSAGPTIDTPGVIDTGPCMCTLRMPSRFSSPLAVALPISLSESISDCGGRSISLVWTGDFTLGIKADLAYQSCRCHHTCRPQRDPLEGMSSPGDARGTPLRVPTASLLCECRKTLVREEIHWTHWRDPLRGMSVSPHV